MTGKVADLFGAGESQYTLDEILHAGAERLLKEALVAEVVGHVQDRSHLLDEAGHRLVVRNGYLPERTVTTQVGRLSVQQPRVRDKRGSAGETFSSSILPSYMRRSPKLDELIPVLYLRGVSTGDMLPALEALVGKSAKGLSASSVTRLTEQWTSEWEEWRKRDLTGQEYVYIWADGIHVNVRLEEDKQCFLVLMGARSDGRKELIAVLDGHRESEQSWHELLVDVKQRGLSVDPKVAVADGALGFWKAVNKVFPTTRNQRCWVHKTGNVLNKLPKKLHPRAKDAIQEIWMADTKKNANKAFDTFVAKYEAKYPAAAACLVKDRDALLAFYDFPAEHWRHLRTTNPIESTFATVRHRHRRTKGSGSRKASLAMIFKLLQCAEKRWRKLNGYEILGEVIEGVTFVDGKAQEAA